MPKRIAPAELPLRRGTFYPPPYDKPCRARERRRLGDAAGLTQFGVNLLRLAPGVWSSQRHWHTRQDEFVYVLEGEVVLVTDAGEEVLKAGDAALESEGSLAEIAEQATSGDYIAIQGFIDPTPAATERLWAVARELEARTGCVPTVGIGPRYLHSTGQLHKGGPNSGLFIQVIDEVGEELPIPGMPFGFGRLIRAQAAGDFASLKERGRRVVRVRLRDLEEVS